MNINKTMFALAMTLGLTTAQAEAPSTTASWAQAINSGNRTALVGLYTRDAVLVSPGSEIVAAPEAISDFWADKRQAGASDFHILSVNERQEGDRVYQSAVWTTKFSSNGKTTELEGQMTNVLVRQPDGSWKIQLQSWN